MVVYHIKELKIKASLRINSIIERVHISSSKEEEKYV